MSKRFLQIITKQKLIDDHVKTFFLQIITEQKLIDDHVKTFLTNNYETKTNNYL